MLRFALFVVFLLVLAIGVQMLPGEHEHISMLLRDKQYAKAFAQLTARYEAGDRHPETLMRLFELHERYGNEKKMQQILNVYKASHPNDLFVREKLADLYFRTNQMENYLKQLESLAERHHKGDHAQKLLAHLKLAGRTDEEKRLLNKFQTMPFFSAAMAGRLAMIELNSGHRDKAMQLFRRMDHLGQQEKGHLEPRLALFRLLVQDGALEDAYQRSRHWVRFDDEGSSNLFVMTKQLRQKGRLDLATKLAGKAQRHRASAVFILSELYIAQKNFAQARFTLAHWRRTARNLSRTDLSKYISSLLAAQNLPGAIEELRLTGVSKMPPRALVAIGAELAWQKQSALLKTIRPFFQLEALSSQPLFAAEIFHQEGKESLARHFLKKSGPHDMSKEQAEIWFDLYINVHGKHQALLRARQLMQKKRLPRNLLDNYAKLARQLGSKKEVDLAWAALGGRPRNMERQLVQGE